MAKITPYKLLVKINKTTNKDLSSEKHYIKSLKNEYKKWKNKKYKTKGWKTRRKNKLKSIEETVQQLYNNIFNDSENVYYENYEDLYLLIGEGNIPPTLFESSYRVNIWYWYMEKYNISEDKAIELYLYFKNKNNRY